MINNKTKMRTNLVMVQHEYHFTRNIKIETFFKLMMENRGRHTGWKFEHDPSIYTIVWTPSILLNIWQVHPKVTASLEVISKTKTRCTVRTVNKGKFFFDLFGIFKKVHEKSFHKLFDEVRTKTKEYESDSKK